MTPVAADACALIGQLSAALAAGRPLSEALRLLAAGLELRSVVVRSAAGEVLAVGGEALQAVPLVSDRRDVWLEFPIAAQDGTLVATLTTRGGRPSQLPALRAAAAVLGLALGDRPGGVPTAQLVEDGEEGITEIADALHDGPLQSLLVARYAADAASRGGDPGAVREAIQQAIVELRQLVWALRPRGDASLRAALEHLAGSAHGGQPLELELAADASGPAAVLAYRLVQVIHRDAQRPVTVSLERGTLDISGAALATSQRWVRRAAAVGCELSTMGEQTRLVLTAAAASSVWTDVRTTS